MIIKEDSKYRLIEANSDNLIENLSAGTYTVELKQGFFSSSLYLDPVGDKYKKGMMINEGIFKKIHEDVNAFLSEEMTLARESLCMMNKSGIMFEGAPGTGKTFLAGQIGEQLVQERNAVCLITTNPNLDFAAIIDIIRQKSPDRFVVLIIDEFEKNYKSSNTSLLSFLDGTESRDNVLVIATVNNMRNLPNYITERPGRFEKIYRFKMTDETILKPLLISIIPTKYREALDTEIGRLVEKLKKEKEITIDSIRMYVRDLIYTHLKLVV